MTNADGQSERYKGRPLLIILENYVLDCIGALDSDTQQRVQWVVQRAFGGEADWKQTVRGVLHLDESFDVEVQQMWQRNQQIAAENNVTLPPAQFAMMICDQNFADMIDTTEHERA